jgi:hypothetical protein
MAHTPGPFRVEGSIYEHMAAEIVAAEPGKERGIAQVWVHPEAMDNAALFAAAPDMLAALTSVVAWKEAITLLAPELGGLLKSIYVAEAAIAKANARAA